MKISHLSRIKKREREKNLGDGRKLTFHIKQEKKRE